MENLQDLITRTLLGLAKQNKKVTTREVIKKLDIKVSRQYLNKIIGQLISEKKISRVGFTKGAFYVFPENIGLVSSVAKIQWRFKNKGIKEHEVLEDVRSKAPFFPLLKDNVQSIFDYAFSEMLNNAIDHSCSENIEVEVFENKENLFFVVNDFGIGVFKSIMQKKALKSETEAIQDLLKGKTTTAPHAHSGEGIFFTSKAADIFILESYNYRLIIDNKINDIFIENLKPFKKGTKVIFKININTARHLNNIFKKYQSDADIVAFNKTEIQIRLYTMGTIYVSRSQARRVLSGLDKFKTIILDFDKVPTIGQGFADEIFRVFQAKHREIKFKPVNMNEAVKFMVDRVEKPK